MTIGRVRKFFTRPIMLPTEIRTVGTGVIKKINGKRFEICEELASGQNIYGEHCELSLRQGNEEILKPL